MESEWISELYILLLVCFQNNSNHIINYAEVILIILRRSKIIPYQKKKKNYAEVKFVKT